MNGTVTNELILEHLKRLHQDVSDVKQHLGRLTNEFHTFRQDATVRSQEVNNLYETAIAHDRRMDRIERRLELDQTEH